MNTLYFLELEVSYKKQSTRGTGIRSKAEQHKMNSQVKKNSLTQMRLIGLTIILRMQLEESACLTCYFAKHFVTSKNWKIACEFSCHVSLYSHPKIPCDDSSVNNTCKVPPAWLGD